eukprot:5669247-Amphidinium_carterae.1
MDKARDEHELWLDSSPTEKAQMEKQYLLGDTKAVSDPHNHFASVVPSGEAYALVDSGASH